MRKGWKRVHRLVVLPDYQGIGIGTRFIEEIAKMYVNEGYVFNLTTTTPSLIYGLAKNPHWKLKRQGRDLTGKNKKRFKGEWTNVINSFSTNRITFSFYYENNNLGDNVFKMIPKQKGKKSNNVSNQITIFDFIDE